MKKIISIFMASTMLIGVAFMSDNCSDIYAKKTHTKKSVKTSGTSKTVKINKALKEYEGLVEEVYNDYFSDGEYYPPMGSGWRYFIAPVIEKKEELSKLENEMTTEQKAKFHSLTEKIKEVFVKR